MKPSYAHTANASGAHAPCAPALLGTQKRAAGWRDLDKERKTSCGSVLGKLGLERPAPRCASGGGPGSGGGGARTAGGHGVCGGVAAGQLAAGGVRGGATREGGAAV
jgi:hypothetical protein